MTISVTKIIQEWMKGINDLPELYLVGGAVRDINLSRSPKDIDLVCPEAESFARRVAHIRRATLVPMEKKANEPCYRVVERNKPDQFIDIAQIRGKDIIEDLCRRDFTINAMAIRIKGDGQFCDLIDPCNGLDDLKNKIIRRPSIECFISDPLRILRAFRFAAQLDFTIEKITWDEICSYRSYLNKVASERIYVELLNLFCAPNSKQNLFKMDESGILEILFPEILPMKNCTQNFYHHKDVWQHSLMVMENCEYIINNLTEFFSDLDLKIIENINNGHRLPLLKFAALFHDVGKPPTKNINNETGRITFYGHEDEGALITERIAQRLKTSNQDLNYLRSIVAEHMHILNLSRPEVKSATWMRLFRNLKDDAIPLIILSIADIEAALGPDSSEERKIAHIEWSQRVIKDYYDGPIKKRIEQKRLINGNDLILLGMEPGPKMGQILKRIDDAQDAGDIQSKEDALLAVKEWLLSVSVN